MLVDKVHAFMVTRIFLSHVNVDYMRPQLWAVDVSTYTLWQAGSKGEALIDACLSCSPDEQVRVKRYLREMDQIREWPNMTLRLSALASYSRVPCRLLGRQNACATGSVHAEKGHWLGAAAI